MSLLLAVAEPSKPSTLKLLTVFTLVACVVLDVLVTLEVSLAEVGLLELFGGDLLFRQTHLLGGEFSLYLRYFEVSLSC